MFQAKTFEEIAELSKQHGTEMYKVQDATHMEAMGKMQELMKSPESMQKWFMDIKAEFDTLPNI